MVKRRSYVTNSYFGVRGAVYAAYANGVTIEFFIVANARIPDLLNLKNGHFCFIINHLKVKRK